MRSNRSQKHIQNSAHITPPTLCWPNQGTWPKSWLYDPPAEKEGRIRNSKPIYHVLSLFYLSSPSVTRFCFVIFLFFSFTPTSGPLRITYCLTKWSLSCSPAINSCFSQQPVLHAPAWVFFLWWFFLPVRPAWETSVTSHLAIQGSSNANNFCTPVIVW